MKKSEILLIALLVAFFSTAFLTHAAPIGTSNNSYNYLLGANNLEKFSGGIYAKERNKKISVQGLDMKLKSRKVMTYLGYDVHRAITAFAMLGSTDQRIEPSTTYGSKETEWGGGLTFHLMDHDLADAGLLENRIRLNLGIEYTRSQMDWAFAEEAKWDELFSSLTVSIVNDIEGSKQYFPNSIALYLGAIYSDMESTSFKGSGEAGFTMGFQFFMTEKTSVEFGFENLDSRGYVVGMNFGF